MAVFHKTIGYGGGGGGGIVSDFTDYCALNII